MRTLQFTAHCAEHQQTDHIQDECRIAQEYVTDLLSKRLVQHGFEASRNEPDKIAVSVESHPLPISVTCESAQDGEGHLVCRINAHADEEQDWFEKIEMQSVIKQLGQAIETTLKMMSHLASSNGKAKLLTHLKRPEINIYRAFIYFLFND